MQTTLRSRYRQLASLLLLLAIVFCTSCTAIERNTASVELSIRQAQATGRPGAYVVSGNTTLPNETRITVTAIRDFESTETPVYAILDRQYAVVEQGSWQADLNLWQPAPDGRLQESWQLSGLSTPADPAATVTFLATLDPANQPAGLRDQVEAEDDATQASLVRFTTDGELYLEASRQVNVPLPSGRTAPPAPTPAAAPRTSGKPVEQTIDRDQPWSKTDAPLRPDQRLQ
ncbi:hypothetical protein H6F67_00835 [Microcoleus sp. FACHB-1515]|uniref:hypothetical protein n=1 Tax=Cyanophyceae TaxID=3028117 RepID=UPI0016830518|nr:hypothetical protein [Microcoleus sp. FACHB-1515]MBD2088418.1 hypothetical protein [Microcoleus sp. FACHB-1515]